MQSEKKRIIILGSTGSIGENALKVVDALSDRLEVVALAARENTEKLLEQTHRFNVKRIALTDASAATRFENAAPNDVLVFPGETGMEELVASTDADVVLTSVVGIVGLKPVMTALKSGKDVALATKEALVAGGQLVVDCAEKHDARILPVDSEHSAVFQCMNGRNCHGVRRIILTASGGPFGDKPEVDFERVTIDEALAHPSWNMGKKISIDSATMMNKGLELIEARWLFGMPMDSIDVVIHPESIVHSMVEFVDGSVIAQMSPSDMRFAIQYALTWPERCPGNLPALDLASLGSLHFQEPDPERFPCLGLARKAAETGGTMPVALNAANEVAVESFLARRIPFPGIWRLIEKVMQEHTAVPTPTMDQILDTNLWARDLASRLVSEQAKPGG